MHKLITLILFMGFIIWNPSIMQRLELIGYDLLIMNSEPLQNENILIVDLDEEFLKTYGGWPLPRSVYGDLITATNAVPGFTILMPNPDIRGKNYDTYFSMRMGYKPTVLANTASTKVSTQGPHVGTVQLGEDPTPWLLTYPGILQLTPDLAESAAGAGVVVSSPELDGVTRRIPLVVGSQNKLYPSFALELLRVAVGDPSYQLKTNEDGIEWVRVPNYPLMNTDANGRIFLNWNTNFYKQTGQEFIENPIDAPFVIFGTTAEGVTNPVPTPAGAKYPHEIQANILHNLITGTAPSSPTWSIYLKYAYGLLSLALLALAVRSVFFSAPTLILIVVGAIYGTLHAYKSSYLIDLSSVVIISILYWAYHTFLSFLSEYRQKLRIKQQFGTYVSPDLVKKLQEDPTLLRLGGSTEQLTFLFSDIRGFTPISEKYQKNPQGLTSLINRFLDNQTEIILKHGGTIDKYMGDCIMAFWGAPLPDENHIENATKAAIEMRIALEELNETLREEGLDQINTGAGINSGPCVVGNFGSTTRFDYSVLGDAVNLAARLESSCKNYDVDLVISEHSLVDGYDYEFLDEVIVKGKSEPVKIYTIRK